VMRVSRVETVQHNLAHIGYVITIGVLQKIRKSRFG
jgi:hypothetical protein